MPEQPTDGLYLGVDVGYSKCKKSLGHCVLKGGAKWEVLRCDVNTLDKFSSDVLLRLLDQYKFAAIALDGPLTPKLESPCDGEKPKDRYRPQEKQTGHLGLQRIRAQPYLSPVGHKLYLAAMKLKELCEKRGYCYELFSKIKPAQDGVILESFPKLWLAVLLDAKTLDERLGAVGRQYRDWQMADWVFRNPVEEGDKGFLKRLSGKGLSIPDKLDMVFTNKDITAAFVSAVGAALAHKGLASVLGSDRYGSFLLPSSSLWHGGWKGKFEVPQFRDGV